MYIYMYIICRPQNHSACQTRSCGLKWPKYSATSLGPEQGTQAGDPNRQAPIWAPKCWPPMGASHAKTLSFSTD